MSNGRDKSDYSNIIPSPKGAFQHFTHNCDVGFTVFILVSLLDWSFVIITKRIIVYHELTLDDDISSSVEVIYNTFPLSQCDKLQYIIFPNVHLAYLALLE